MNDQTIYNIHVPKSCIPCWTWQPTEHTNQKIIHNTSLLPLFKRKAWANQKSILCSSKGLTTHHVREKPLSQWVKWSRKKKCNTKERNWFCWKQVNTPLRDWQVKQSQIPRWKKRIKVLWRLTLWKRLRTTVQRKQGKGAIVSVWSTPESRIDTNINRLPERKDLKVHNHNLTNCQEEAGPHSNAEAETNYCPLHR